MSSCAGLFGMRKQTAYGVSKVAIVALTQYVATQHGKENIRCNAIAPGLILTAETPPDFVAGERAQMLLRHHLMPRLGESADIAELVVFLASDAAAFITGLVIPVDGGLMAHDPTYADTA
jgi:NAD(P)-dependent dehydrogenase (short-subunit alcohol dehydrogenase family)